MALGQSKTKSPTFNHPSISSPKWSPFGSTLTKPQFPMAHSEWFPKVIALEESPPPKFRLLRKRIQSPVNARRALFSSCRHSSSILLHDQSLPDTAACCTSSLLPTPPFTQASPGMSSKKPPPPTGFAPPPPGRPPSKFRFHRPLQKPKKLADPPSAKDEFLHLFCMSALGLLFFVGGAIYFAMRRPRYGFGTPALIIGGVFGICCLYQLCKRED